MSSSTQDTGRAPMGDEFDENGNRKPKTPEQLAKEVEEAKKQLVTERIRDIREIARTNKERAYDLAWKFLPGTNEVDKWSGTTSWGAMDQSERQEMRDAEMAAREFYKSVIDAICDSPDEESALKMVEGRGDFSDPVVEPIRKQKTRHR